MRQARRLVRDWLETLPPGATFTARDVCDAVPCYQGLRPQEVTNYLRTTEGVRRDGTEGKLARYVWEGSA